MKIPLGLLLVCCISTLVPANAEPIYELVRKIENPNGPVNGITDDFGYSLGQIGGNLLVGAHQEDTGANGAGAAYLFDPNGNLLTTFHNPTPQANEQFGFAVHGFGDKVIIGAAKESSIAGNSGAAYLYEADGTLLQTIMNPTPETNDRFGRSLSSSTVRVVGQA